MLTAKNKEISSNDLPPQALAVDLLPIVLGARLMNVFLIDLQSIRRSSVIDVRHPLHDIAPSSTQSPKSVCPLRVASSPHFASLRFLDSRTLPPVVEVAQSGIEEASCGSSRTHNVSAPVSGRIALSTIILIAYPLSLLAHKMPKRLAPEQWQRSLTRFASGENFVIEALALRLARVGPFSRRSSPHLRLWY